MKRKKLDEKVDVSSFEAEREGLRTQLVQARGAKDKLMQQLDKKNAFDIEKFLNHKLTLEPEDRYTVVKPDEVKMDR